VASIFDPNYTGVGHQPYGHDEWATRYNQYAVISCVAYITFRWEGTPNTQVACGAFMDTDAAAPTLLSTKMERYPGAIKILKKDQCSSVTIKVPYNAKMFHKIKDLGDDHQISAVFGATPMKFSFLNMFVQSLDSATTNAAIMIDVRLRQKVHMFEPKPILGS